MCVQASTLGSLEALLEFLRSPAVKIPVSGISIGPIHKRDIMRANVMMEKVSLGGAVSSLAVRCLVQPGTGAAAPSAGSSALPASRGLLGACYLNGHAWHKHRMFSPSCLVPVQGTKKYACLLAFDVPVTKEAREMAESLGVRIFTADIIYHLFDQFTAYLEEVRSTLLKGK